MIMQLSAVLTPAEEGGYVAHNPETMTTTDGETIEEALANLREAVELYLEEAPLRVRGNILLSTITVNDNASSAAA
jgi:predicted RNase H-like HicB family nuclease